MKLLLFIYFLMPLQEDDSVIYSQNIMYEISPVKGRSGMITVFQNKVIFQPKKEWKGDSLEIPLNEITSINKWKVPPNRLAIRTKDRKYLFFSYKRKDLYEVLDSLINKRVFETIP